MVISLANWWFASGNITSGNSLPLANIIFGSGKCDTTGEPVTSSPAVSAIPLANQNLCSPVIYISAFKIKAEMYYSNLYTSKFIFQQYI